jgi:hypothetical protein
MLSFVSKANPIQMNARIIQPFIVLIIATIMASCSQSFYQASWQEKAIMTDGIPTEWSLPLRFSDTESGLQYNITNDTDNLYICIRSTEASTQMRMITTGTDIWIDPNGKYKHITGIHFPVNTRDDLPPRMEVNNFQKANRQIDLQKHLLERDHSMRLSGFLPKYNGTYSSSGSKDIQAAISQDSLGFITCEYTLPFRTFYPKTLTTLYEAPVFGIEMILPASRNPSVHDSHAKDRNEHPAGEGRPEGGPPQGGQRMGGNRMEEGRGEHSRPSSEEPNRSSEASIKIKIRLNSVKGK